MSRIAAFSKHEFASLLWRSGGIVLASATSLLAVRALVQRDAASAGGLIALIGWIAFLPLLTLGFGRPVYSAVRERFARNLDATALTRRYTRLFVTLGLLALLVYATLGPWVVLRQAAHEAHWELVLFACGLVATASGCFSRDIAYATSAERRFEKTEFARKAIALCGFLMLAFGLPLGLAGGFMLVAGLLSHLNVASLFAPTPHQDAVALTTAEQVEQAPRLARDASRFWTYSANEVILYNLPLIFFTWQANAAELIFFGVWSRLFQLIVLPMRVLADARVNRQTAAYFQGDTANVRHQLNASLKMSLATVAVTLTLAGVGLHTALGWLGTPSLSQNPWLLPSLAVWSLGNAIQHVFGAFVLSYGQGFKFALRASFSGLLATALAFSACYAATANQGLALTAAGVAYGLFALLYRRHAMARTNPGNPQP